MRASSLTLASALLLTSASGGIAAVDAETGVTDGAARCAAMKGIEVWPGTTITSAQHVAAAGARPAPSPGAPPTPALPAYCKLDGVIDPHEGIDGKSYAVGFSLALPDAWNGRFLQQGGGGLNGVVRQPIGGEAAGEVPALARGFAVISHDGGHKGAVFEQSFLVDQRAALDFAETAVLKAALRGKALTEHYYRKPIAHSYMTGCSTGGREGMLAMQRYPELFDGIVIGAPAMRPGYSNFGIEYATVMLNRAAPRDDEGKPIVSRIFSNSDRKTILSGLLGQCDALDGRIDGMIMAVSQCHFRPEKLQCASGKQDGCLSSAQVDGLQRAFAGPKDAAGYPVYAPIPYDTGIVATGAPLPGYLPTGAPGVFGPASRATDIDVDARLQELRADGNARLTDTNVWTNLSTYLGHGGKALFFHGVSDPWFSPLDTLDYWNRAAAANGTAFTEASRFYMVPGMMHCQGGNAFDNFDLLSPLVDWVESGKPAAAAQSARSDGSETRPMCPYPSYAHYDRGDPAIAASYSCRVPAKD